MNGGPRGSFELSEFSSFWHDECWFKPTLPTEPRLYAPVGGNGRIDLSWVEPWWDGGRSVSVSHYKVYRASTCAGPFALAATTPNRFWSDTGLAAGESRCYQVTAVNSVGEGPAEPGRSATTWTAPRPPAALSVTRGGDGELRVTWTPSPDHAGPGPVLAYRLYRATSASGPFSLIAIPGASATTYLDTGLGKGATRHYRIAAVNGVGEGAPSATRAGTTWQLPGIPLNVQATAQIGLQPVQVQVTWEAPAEGNDLTLYRIYYATSPTAEPRLIGEVHHAQRSFVDALQTPLFDHHYEVRAFNPAGEGAPSARTCVVWPTSTPLGRC